MHARAPSTCAGAALATMLLSCACSANPILCSESAAYASRELICASDSNDRKPALPSALSHDWNSLGTQIKPGAEKHDEHLFQRWHRLDSSQLWIPGIAAHEKKWAQTSLHWKSDRSIPAPSSLALLGIGLVCAALSHRFKRR